MIAVRTHQNRWIVRERVSARARAMITQTAAEPYPVFRIVLCAIDDCRDALTDEAHTLDEAVDLVIARAGVSDDSCPVHPSHASAKRSSVLQA